MHPSFQMKYINIPKQLGRFTADQWIYDLDGQGQNRSTGISSKLPSNQKSKCVRFSIQFIMNMTFNASTYYQSIV
jgi:hypothetical protein